MPKATKSNTGNGPDERLTPESRAARNGAPTAGLSAPTVGSMKAPASAGANAIDDRPKSNLDDGDIPEVQADKANQIVVINATLTRIEKWFGTIQTASIGNGRIVMLLPEGLVWCQYCRRVRLNESMLGDGHCQQCQNGMPG